MTTVNFPETNTTFGPPPGIAESQVMPVRACVRQAAGGSMDGSMLVVVAWQPSGQELEDLKDGKPVYISMVGGLAPHFLTTDFNQAVLPA